MSPDFRKDLQHIIKKYVEGKASAEEIKFVESYYQYLAKNPAVPEFEAGSAFDDIESKRFTAIKANIEAKERKRDMLPFYRYAVAASFLLLIGIGISYFTINESIPKVPRVAKAPMLDVLPGIDQAVLTLANGTKIVLDDTNKEKVIDKTGLTVSKTKDGQLIYTAIAKNNNPKVAGINTIQTAKGNQYQIVLPDGTRVWLNASSSLKFPEVFNGSIRKVELIGEAYFEVTKDKAHPFIVKTINDEVAQEVKVIGTHFNINGYMDDHHIKTTLLEGSVSVSSRKLTKLLKPGEQSVLDEEHIGVLKVDTDEEIAWKDGQFRFNNTNLKNILYQLERWYDIKVDYSHIPVKRFNGMVPRKAKLSEVLKMLSLTGNIQFNLQADKKLTVTSK